MVTQVCEKVFSESFCTQVSENIGWGTALTTAVVGTLAFRYLPNLGKSADTSKEKWKEIKRALSQIDNGHLESVIEITDSSGKTRTQPRYASSQNDSPFDWVGALSKEELENTLVDGMPIFHWSLINSSSELAKTFRKKGFTNPTFEELKNSWLSFKIPTDVPFQKVVESGGIEEVKRLLFEGSPDLQEAVEFGATFVAIYAKIGFETQFVELKKEWENLRTVGELLSQKKDKEASDLLDPGTVQVNEPQGKVTKLPELSKRKTWSWILHRTKEELQKTTIDGTPIAIKALGDEKLLIHLIHQGFSMDDLELDSPLSRYRQVLLQEFPELMKSIEAKKLSDELDRFEELPPEAEEVEKAKNLTMICLAEVVSNYLHSLLEGSQPLKNSRIQVAFPNGEIKEEESYSFFKWLEGMSKEELTETKIDGVPVWTWACIRGEKEVMAKMIHAGFDQSDLDDVSKNWTQHLLNCFSEPVFFTTQNQRELFEEFLSRPFEKVNPVVRTGLIVLNHFAELFLKDLPVLKNWADYERIAQLL